MAEKMKFCVKCKKAMTDKRERCPLCGSEFVVAPITDIYWNKISADEQQKYIEEYCINKVEKDELISQEYMRMNEAIEAMILTSTPSIEGYKIVKQCGLVFGEVFYRSSLKDSILSSLDDGFNFSLTESEELTGIGSQVKKAREYAMNKIKIEADKRGANAIIGIDAESSMGRDVAHIMIYGTAVVIEECL